MRVRTMAIATAAAGVITVASLWGQGRGNPTDWPTAYGDAQHSSWIRGDGNISLETMSQPGFGLQWTARLESPARQAVSLSQGVVTPGVNLFTPISTVAGPENLMFAFDNDTGNVFWTRRFDGQVPAGTAACPGGITGAPTRMVNLVVSPGGPARGGGGRRGGRAYGGLTLSDQPRGRRGGGWRRRRAIPFVRCGLRAERRRHVPYARHGLWQGRAAPGALPASRRAGRSFWTGSGHVFVGTRDGTVYAFGFDMERGAPSWRKGS